MGYSILIDQQKQTNTKTLTRIIIIATFWGFPAEAGKLREVAIGISKVGRTNIQLVHGSHLEQRIIRPVHSIYASQVSDSLTLTITWQAKMVRSASLIKVFLIQQ